MRAEVGLLKVLGIALATLTVTGAGGVTGQDQHCNYSAPAPEIRDLDWWEHSVLYQIYPRSFKDSDGDGVGDLRGIISRLEHFKDIGVDAIWLSPIFTSPMVDFGYDISDFYDIHDEYGTMEDFEALIAKAHELGIKVLLDFVPNHASTESIQFKNSEARVPGYEDFFIWADPIPGPDNTSLVPSNWVGVFGQSSWQWSELRQQYYLHQFTIEQADFNFRSQNVKDFLLDIMKFWLDKGANGFRLDALPYLFEANPDDHDGRFPDEPLRGTGQGLKDANFTTRIYTKDLAEIYDILYDWREYVEKYHEEVGGDTRVLFAEAYANISMTMLYYGNDKTGRVGAHLPFNFDFVTILNAKSNARDFVYITLRWLTYMPYGAVPNWVISNHDNNRMASRFRNNMVDGLNALMLLLPGLSVTYQGDEMGMTDGYVSWEHTVDVKALNRGGPDTYLLYSRDPCRTPFHWDNSTSAGFSNTSNSWLPIAENYMELNLAKEKEDVKSHYKAYKHLTTLRKQERSLSHGETDMKALSDNTFYLVRYLSTYDTLVLLFNVGTTTETISLDRVKRLSLPATVEVASLESNRYFGDQISDNELSLAAGEALVLRTAPVLNMNI